MAFKMIALFATLAYASAGFIEADNAPLAHYSSAPAVSYSSITRHDSQKVAVANTVALAQPAVQYVARQSYAVHEPSVLNTVVAQPAIVQQPSFSYAQAAPLVKNLEYSNALSYAPLAKTVVSQPAYTNVYNAQPAYAKAIVAQPAYSYAQAAPLAVSAPLVNNLAYSNQLSYAPLAKTIVAQPAYSKTLVSEPIYAQAAPVVAAKTLSYAPAAQISHVSFADNSAQYGW